jgi:DeoR family glycerol-3-phosphate regulon repressor
VSGLEKTGMVSRHDEIISLIRRRGFVSIGGLAETFQVSEQTVRRDLKNLAERGLVTKYHGGAGMPHGPADIGYDKRKGHMPIEKQRIAKAVAARIPEGATVFIDIGTTMEAVAEQLLDHQRLTVVTNHVTVATILSRRSEFQVILAGGILRHNDHATTGEATRAFLERFRVGYGIFGIGGVDDDGALLDFDFRDIGVSNMAMRISRRRFVALDHSKFGADAVVSVGHVSDVDTLFTDAEPPTALKPVLASNGVEVVLC